METPSLNSLYIAIAVLTLFLVVVFLVCLKLIGGQDQNHAPHLQPEVRVIPSRRPVPLELARPPVKHRRTRSHKQVTRSSQTVRATFPLDSDDDAIRVERVDVFGPGYESITAVLRGPTLTQAHSECLER